VRSPGWDTFSDQLGDSLGAIFEIEWLYITAPALFGEIRR
jgi:hypothetical protein